MERFKIPIGEHLEDEDNLLMGRDTELVPGQEHIAEEIANNIYEHAIEQNAKILLFCVSPKKRVKETAELVKKYLDNKPVKLKMLFEVDPNLREMDQGEFILPANYKPGDNFVGLNKARKIFASEVRNTNDPNKDNLKYHFGDSVLQENGDYKYPELNEYFSKHGESFQEMFLRYLHQILKLSENLDRFSEKVLPVIFTHGQPKQFFIILEKLAERIVKEGYTFEEGKLPSICRDLYQPRTQGVDPYGQIDFVSIENVCKPEIIELLKKEIDHLELL